ncbi:MAG: hypothetical protein U0Q22_03820 [Acidimicrobiales bacterium]
MSSELIEQPAAPAVSGCPVPHVAAAASAPEGVCPFPHAGAPGVQRSRADLVVRKLLRIKERPANVSENAALKAFEKSMLISATRCTLTYVVFPFLLPLLSLSKTVGAGFGAAIGAIAMVCDVFTIRRFFAIDHKWRWYFTAAALTVITMLTVLLVQDILNLTR